MKPVSDAGSDQTVDEGTLVIFDGSSSTDDVSIMSYTWTFEDVTSQILEDVNPNYTFTNPGTYVVTLNVTDAVGNSNTDSVTIKVNDITVPVAETGDDQTVDEDTMVTLDGSRSTDNDEIVRYTWTFTDETEKTLEGEKGTYTFTKPGIYPITLTVTDGAGNSNTDIVTITIKDVTSPTADIESDREVGVNEQVGFDASGSSDNVGIVKYEWDFGDGSTGTGEATTHTYTEAETYTVTLILIDVAGNSITETVLVEVEAEPEPEPESPGGIPGFNIEAVLAGVLLSVLLIWYSRR